MVLHLRDVGCFRVCQPKLRVCRVLRQARSCRQQPPGPRQTAPRACSPPRAAAAGLCRRSHRSLTPARQRSSKQSSSSSSSSRMVTVAATEIVVMATALEIAV
jgi:hypothetical protein